MDNVKNTPPKSNAWDAGMTTEESAQIEKMIQAVGVSIIAPKMMKRAQQTMNDIISGNDDKEIII